MFSSFNNNIACSDHGPAGNDFLTGGAHLQAGVLQAGVLTSKLYTPFSAILKTFFGSSKMPGDPAHPLIFFSGLGGVGGGGGGGSSCHPQHPGLRSRNLKSLNSKTDISIFINLRYLRLKLLKNNENNKKICHTFHHNFKNIPCYVMSEVSLKRIYFVLFDDGPYFKNFEIGVYRFLNSNSSYRA